MLVSYCFFVVIIVVGIMGEGFVRVIDGSELYRGYFFGFEYGFDLVLGVGVCLISYIGFDDGY